MNELWTVVALFAAGIALRRLGIFPSRPGGDAGPGGRPTADDAFKVLATFVVYVSLPGAILLRVPKLEVSAEVLVPILMPWAMLGISAALVLAAARARSWDRSTTGALLLVVPLGNTSFLGLPMVRAFLGESAVPYALLYDQFGTFLALATYGSVVIATYAGTSRPTARAVLRRIATFPPFLSLIVALALRGVALPRGLESALDAAAQSLVPVIMVAVGLQLSLRSVATDAEPLVAGLTVKMLVAPAIAWLLCTAIGARGSASVTSIFEAGMPPMITAGALAAQAGLRPSLAIGAVGVGLVLSFVTLPILHALM